MDNVKTVSRNEFNVLSNFRDSSVLLSTCTRILIELMMALIKGLDWLTVLSDVHHAKKLLSYVLFLSIPSYIYVCCTEYVLLFSPIVFRMTPDLISL